MPDAKNDDSENDRFFQHVHENIIESRLGLGGQSFDGFSNEPVDELSQNQGAENSQTGQHPDRDWIAVKSFCKYSLVHNDLRYHT